MVGVNLLKWRLVRPGDADYVQYAQEYGVNGVHFMVSRYNPNHSRVLPRTYRTFKGDGRSAIVKM